MAMYQSFFRVWSVIMRPIVCVGVSENTVGLPVSENYT